MTGVEPDDHLADRERYRVPAQPQSGAEQEDLGFGSTLIAMAAAAIVLLVSVADSIEVVSGLLARCIAIARTLVAFSHTPFA